MKSYKSTVFNKKYFAGSTGAVIEVYDKSKKLAAKFEGHKMVYDLTMSPDDRLLCAKSAKGYFCIYSLESFCLLKKVEIGKGFDSVDGAMIFSSCFCRFYNVEACDRGCTVAVYDTENFSLEERIELPQDTYICDFECWEDVLYVIGYLRGEDGYSFIGKLCDGEIGEAVKITKNELELYAELKCLENRGRKIGRFIGDVERFIDRGFSLKKLYEYRKENII